MMTLSFKLFLRVVYQFHNESTEPRNIIHSKPKILFETNLEININVASTFLDSYLKRSIVDNADKVFDEMPNRNTVSWNMVISNCNKAILYDDAWRVFCRMHMLGFEMNMYTYGGVLSACSGLTSTLWGEQVYALVMKNGFFWYVRCGMIDLFNPTMAKEAIQIRSWIFITGFYQDQVVKTSSINMYSKIGEVALSKLVFAEAENLQHIGLWSNMISVLAQNNYSDKVIYLLRRMFQEDLKPDKFCCSSALGVVNCLDLGKQLHSYTLKSGLLSNVNVSSSLFTMYSKCGSIEESYIIFELIEDKDNISWASMIAGLVEHGFSDRAIELFREMPVEEIIPDETAILDACSSLQTLKIGKEVHASPATSNYRSHKFDVVLESLVFFTVSIHILQVF